MREKYGYVVLENSRQNAKQHMKRMIPAMKTWLFAQITWYYMHVPEILVMGGPYYYFYMGFLRPATLGDIKLNILEIFTR